MKNTTAIPFTVVGAVENYFPSFYFFSMVRNKAKDLKGYLYLADQNKKLEEANKALLRRIALKDRLLSILSHDIRSPLNSLRSFMNLLMRDNLTQKEVYDVARNLDYQAEQLSYFLENLLRWTKRHFDQFHIKSEKLSLHSLVKETVALLSLSANTKQIRIESDVSEDVIIYSDAEIIKLILRNLISNAIKFCDAGDQIYIHSKDEHGIARISVKDTGRGISKENIQKLFDVYHLSTNGTKGEIGTGLGLTLCREFIEKMGGEIRVTSIEGHGSCFEFTVTAIPISKTNNNRVPVLK